MADIKIIGAIQDIKATESFGTKGNKKRVVQIEETDVPFPNYFQVEFSNAACETMDNYTVGDLVEVTASVRGRKYEKDEKTMVFTTLAAWKIKRI